MLHSSIPIRTKLLMITYGDPSEQNPVKITYIGLEDPDQYIQKVQRNFPIANLHKIRELNTDQEETLWMHEHFAKQKIAQSRDWFYFHPDMLTIRYPPARGNTPPVLEPGDTYVIIGGPDLTKKERRKLKNLTIDMSDLFK